MSRSTYQCPECREEWTKTACPKCVEEREAHSAAPTGSEALRRGLSAEELTDIRGELGALGDLMALCGADSGAFMMNGYTEAENTAMWAHLDRLNNEFRRQSDRLELIIQAHCDHKFVDSKTCLKCGWKPPNEKGQP